MKEMDKREMGLYVEQTYEDLWSLVGKVGELQARIGECLKNMGPMDGESRMSYIMAESLSGGATLYGLMELYEGAAKYNATLKERLKKYASPLERLKNDISTI